MSLVTLQAWATLHLPTFSPDLLQWSGQLPGSEGLQEERWAGEILGTWQ